MALSNTEAFAEVQIKEVGIGSLSRGRLKGLRTSFHNVGSEKDFVEGYHTGRQRVSTSLSLCVSDRRKIELTQRSL